VRPLAHRRSGIARVRAWVAKVDILITDFDEITLEQSFDVPR
jgi:hypothetical protein